jgi:bla regulator protein BlaR1
MPWLSFVVSNVILALSLALAAWFIQRRFRCHAIAHILWVLVLVKLVTPPLVSVSLLDRPTNEACLNGTCSCGPHLQTAVRDTLAWMLLTAWLLGAAVTSWTAWRRWTRFRSLLAHAVPAPAEWLSLAAHLSNELALRKVPEVLVVPGQLPPLVVPGWHRPRLLLPEAMIDQLNESQQSVLLLHELVHIKRRDHLVRLLELAVSIVYWWLPIVGLIGRQLRDCEEACCDAAVIARKPQARRDYARLLLDVLDFVSPLPPTPEHATAMNSAHDLERRLRAILGATTGTPQRWWPIGVFAVALACSIVPWGFHYDWAGELVLMAAPLEPVPAPDSAPTSIDDSNFEPVKNICCPSRES